MRRWHWLIVALAFLLAANDAWGHLTPNSEVQIDFGRIGAMADIIIPQGEYGYATGNPTGDAPNAVNRARAYLADRIRVSSADGRPWSVAFETVEFVTIAGPPDLHVIARLTPPAGENARRMTISWSAIVDRVPNHFVVFVARTDFEGGKLSSDREVLGAIQGAQRALTIDRGTPAGAKGFFSAVGLGMSHIAEGHHHLLFLIVLLLPAPIAAAGLSWGRPVAPRQALVRLAKIVTAFTIGHSMTLIGAAFLGWQLPAQPVEIGIAFSILISAIHAWRPLFPGREPIVAAVFGLVHGLAFATVVARFGLGFEEKALSILGFNIGIEIVQLAVVMAVLPALLMLSRTPAYPAVRRAGAALAGLAALAWIVERVNGTPNLLAGSIDVALSYAPLAIVPLTIVVSFIYRQSIGKDLSDFAAPETDRRT